MKLGREAGEFRRLLALIYNAGKIIVFDWEGATIGLNYQDQEVQKIEGLRIQFSTAH